MVRSTKCADRWEIRTTGETLIVLTSLVRLKKEGKRKEKEIQKLTKLEDDEKMPSGTKPTATSCYHVKISSPETK